MSINSALEISVGFGVGKGHVRQRFTTVAAAAVADVAAVNGVQG